jgi:hypothetical protein
MKNGRSSAASVAEKAGISPQNVNRRRRRGESDESIIENRHEQAPRDETLIDAQLRKESALANLRELEFQQKQGDVIPVAMASAAWAQLCQMVRQKLSALPNALCDQLAAMTDPTEVRLFLIRETDRCAAQLADDFLDAGAAIVDSGGEGDAATDPADGDGVGGE